MTLTTFFRFSVPFPHKHLPLGSKSRKETEVYAEVKQILCED